MSTYFSAALFFVVLRETLEVSIIVSVLFAFIDRLQFTNTKIPAGLRRSVWLGTATATLIVGAVGTTLVTIWYKLGTNYFESSELLYEGIFGLVAAVFITATSFAFLKGQYLYDRMTRKLEAKFHNGKTKGPVVVELEPSCLRTSSSLSSDTTSEHVNIASKDVSKSDLDTVKVEVNNITTDTQTYSSQIFFWVPFITIVREGLETVLLIGGVSFSEPSSSIPLAAATAITIGVVIGFIIHRASGKLSLQWFFVGASFVLFLMAAGIFSRSVGFLEDNAWSKLSGPNEYAETPQFDPRNNIWYLPNAWEKKDAGFGLLFSLLGYRSVATVGTILSYISYWVMIISSLAIMKYGLVSKIKARFIQ